MLKRSETSIRRLVAVWALGGFLAIIGQALLGMGPTVLGLLSGPLSPAGWLAVAASVAGFGVVKGYFAFHRGFAPRFARRLRALVTLQAPALRVFAPLFCMGLIPARRSDGREWLRTLGFTALIVLMIVGVQGVGPTTRAVIVTGVLVALIAGAISTVYQSVRTLRASSASIHPMPAAGLAA